MSIEAKLNRIEKAVKPTDDRGKIEIILTDDEGKEDKLIIEMKGQNDHRTPN